MSEKKAELVEICLSLENMPWCLILSFGRADHREVAQNALLPDAARPSFQRDRFLNR